MKSDLGDILLDFRKEKKSIMAFNLQNFYQLQAAKVTTERLMLPAIIQFSERYLRFLDKRYGINYIIKKYKNDYTYFHLDHCTDINFIMFCIDSGFDSVMYDGSAFTIDENIKSSKIVKAYAAKHSTLLEGELGKVSGVEDGFGDNGSSYAEISEIMRYVRETAVDLMALGIGNAHGFYETFDGLNLEILREASQRLSDSQLYVLHGGTGLPDNIIRQAISYGVVKINISTQLKKKTMDAIKLYAHQNEIFNEIAYDRFLVEELSGLMESYVMKYTK